jgi:hypothetical protein
MRKAPKRTYNLRSDNLKSSHLFAFNKLRRINKRTSSMKSILTAKTGFASQLWHSREGTSLYTNLELP